MIVNARMYSVSPAAGDAWRQLLLGVARKAGLAVESVEHPPPAPISALWARADMAAVFMCGLPYSRSQRGLDILAAPVPSPPRFAGEAQYWSEFVVRADSSYQTLADTFGHRLALTTPEAQSGYAAPLHHLMPWAGRKPLFRALIEPQITPVGAITAVIDGAADVAPLDSYAFCLLQRFRPDLTDQVRIVDRTPSRPIPPLVASNSDGDRMWPVLLAVDEDPEFALLLSELQLTGFVRPDPSSYDLLWEEYNITTDFWRRHPIAADTHFAFDV
jgi:ABC-type phosphate/phosphonate transport system substrate-binding protein